MSDWSRRQQDFYNQMWPLALDASTRSGVPAQVIFAQSALETGWGRSAPQNNYFGIKGAGGSQQTREYINGRWVTINDSFRGYSSMADSVRGYVDFITNPASTRWTAARNAQTPEQAARAIAAGGYATDPNYVDKLMSIIRGLPNPFRVGSPGADPSQSVPTNPTLFGQGGMLDRLTISPGEVAGHAESGIKKALEALGDPAKRVGFVVMGLLLVTVAIFVILKGPNVVMGAVSAGVTKGKSLTKKAAMETVA